MFQRFSETGGSKTIGGKLEKIRVHSVKLFPVVTVVDRKCEVLARQATVFAFFRPPVGGTVVDDHPIDSRCPN